MNPDESSPSFAEKIVVIERQLDKVWQHLTPPQRTKPHLVNRFVRLKQLVQALKIASATYRNGLKPNAG